ncbi:MAG: FAD-dependent oxidoreductase [Pseudomonadota bacterium]
MNDQVDILVIGGGVAGMTAALALSQNGARVLCIDAAPEGAGSADTRTTAFLRPAVELLSRIGVWPRLSGEIAALETMRLIDAGGRENAAREIADFHAAEVAEPPFGWNVPNITLRAALREAIADASSASIRFGVGLERLTTRRDHVIAALSDGSKVRARLVVGADGRDSAVRRLTGIGERRWRYGQKGLVFAVHHEEPHLGVSTEIHRTGGPFTLVPMPDREGRYASSVVWMERAAEADRLAALDDAAFNDALNERSLGVLGRLDVASPRAAWPIISLLADRLTGPRTALIAEAAHVVPPIGAQGLNMSLADIVKLEAVIAGGDPGRASALARYQTRWPELAARVAGVDALNRAALAETQPVRDLRRAGLGVIARARPVRRAAMRLGLGVKAQERASD